MILMNGAALAYLGDAIYEVEIRKYLLTSGIQDVNVLHKKAIHYTSGDSQALIMKHFLANEVLSEVELSYYKRGRNSNHSKNRRSISVTNYKMATGFEALIGYLYYNNEIARINSLVRLAIKIVEEERNGTEKSD